MTARARTTGRWWRMLPLAAFALLLVRTAWCSDDAYITYRTIDNFLHGYGLRWNVFERVQAYTHPLWMACMTALVFVTREFYVTGLVFSMLVALAALGHLVFRMASSTAAALAVSALLLSSKAFVEYSTSGLENPLTNLLLVLFIATYLTRRHVFWLALLACLGTLNRMDTVLFYAPVLVAELWRLKSRRALASVIVGFAPFAVWEAFSFVYYGFFFPNTAYAKLNTGIASADLARQGAQYFLSALEMDPVTIAGITAGMVAPIVLRERRMLPIVAGIALYLVYIVKVGGDFMMGRFFAAPLCAAACVLVALEWRAHVAWIVAVASIGLSFVPIRPMFTTGSDYGREQDTTNISRNVGDQRFMYYSGTGLLSSSRDGWEPTYDWINRGREFAREGPGVRQIGAVGFQAFYAGPEVTIIDFHALTDALLARLPADERKQFVVAHFKRTLPAGYEASVRARKNLIEDPDLAAYYDALRKITEDPVWSAERWVAIWDMQLGRLDPRIDAYLARNK
jgi:arabinofuranosyltransferase